MHLMLPGLMYMYNGTRAVLQVQPPLFLFLAPNALWGEELGIIHFCSILYLPNDGECVPCCNIQQSGTFSDCAIPWGTQQAGL